MKKYCYILLFIITISCISETQNKHQKPPTEVKKTSPKESKKSAPFFNLIFEKQQDRIGTFYEVSEIHFTYHQKQHRLKYDMIITDSLELKNPKIFFADFNFDGYKDLMIYKPESGVQNYLYDRFLYDSKKQSFYFHAELSTLINCGIDSVNKTLTSIVNKGGGKASPIQRYQWKQGALIPLD